MNTLTSFWHNSGEYAKYFYCSSDDTAYRHIIYNLYLQIGTDSIGSDSHTGR